MSDRVFRERDEKLFMGKEWRGKERSFSERDMYCRSRTFEGLGIRNLKSRNLLLLVKWL